MTVFTEHSGGVQPGPVGGHGRPPLRARPGRRHPPGQRPAGLGTAMIFVVQERRVVAALRAHGLPSRLDALFADLDRGLVLEAEALRTAAEHGFAPDAELLAGLPRLYLLSSLRRLRRRLGGLTALYGPSVPTWTPGPRWPSAARTTRPTTPGSRTGAAGIPRLRLHPRPGPRRARRDAIAFPDRPPWRALHRPPGSSSPGRCWSGCATPA